MGKYSVYAVQLDHAFKEARTKYTEAYEAVKVAEKRVEDAKHETDSYIKGDADLYRADCALSLQKAKAAFDIVADSVWVDFDRQRKEIGDALESTLTKTCMADPEEVDQNGLTILQSGILSVDELEMFYNRYSDNFTMQRLIAQHVKKLASEERDTERRNRLTMLHNAAGAGPAGVLDAWKSLSEAARICSGQAHGKGAPSYVLSISSQWEGMTEQAIRNF